MKFVLPRAAGVQENGATVQQSRTALKGTGFSPYKSAAKNPRALAPVGVRVQSRWERTLCTTAFLLVLAASPCAPQTGSQPPTQPPSNSPSNTPSNGKVIFSRSIDANGQASTTAAAPVALAKAPIATDDERSAVTFTAYDLDVHLHPADAHIAVRAVVTVRNDGKVPLAYIPLEISSQLNWERIRTGGHDVPFEVATLNSDEDHTGQLHEAAVPLGSPLAPGATLTLDVTYSGAIVASAQRLVAIGTPDDEALHADWDAIGSDFTGLRGFGNVVWYPVSSVPVILGDGNRLFDEMGEQKLRNFGAAFRLRLTDEFPDAIGQAPTVAVINGHPVPLTVTSGGGSDVASVATAALEGARLGFQAPSLFVAIRKPFQATDATLWTLADDEPTVSDWSAAAAKVAPFLEGWLGAHPRSQLTVLDLPDPQDAPYETGTLLAAPIREGNAAELDGAMAHGLTHAWLQTETHAPPAWIDEGLASFMGTLWLEKTSGRTKALESLEADRQALAVAEPSSPGESAGQPLAQATSPIYYRTKAAYVFWMLRDLAGDSALSAALRDYDPAQDASWKPGATTSELEKLIQQHAQRDLGWFFADWVDADKGLPDLAIDSVFPSSAQAGNMLVAVNLSNSGYASAEVPVTVLTDNASVTQRILVPARGKADRRILVQGPPTRVQANDGAVPEIEASIHVKHLTDTDDSSPLTSQPGAPPQ